MVARRAGAICLALAALAGCEDTSVREPPAQAMVAQPIPEGTVGRGEFEVEAALAGERRLPPDREVLRGRERYEIHCAHCHGIAGYGDGIVAMRGFPPPASLHEERLRQMPLAEMVTVVTEGRGFMPSYANRVAPTDRWAIATYIRALQLSQGAPLTALPDEERRGLEGR